MEHFQRAHLARLFRRLAAVGRWGGRRGTYFGFKLTLLTTLIGIPLGVNLVLANLHHAVAGEAVLDRQRDAVTVADQAIHNAPWRRRLAET